LGETYSGHPDPAIAEMITCSSEICNMPSMLPRYSSAPHGQDTRYQAFEMSS